MSDRSAPQPEPLQAGSLLAEKYRLEREIGRGAMGTVWLATHVSLDQQVAIKIISREHADSTELRQRFSTEAKAAAKLRSRYVVGVYDHGETPEGLPFIVLEYLEGESLEDRLAREITLPLEDALRVARHVGRALSRAHAHGIVHRDLKPANIFLSKSDDDEEGWTAKVLDFGVAKMDYGDRSATKTGTLIGTPLFMSPEQVRGSSDADHRSDLYSLGMVVYNMLTGQYAFDKVTFGDLLISICTDPLPRLRNAAPWVPEEVEDWFQKACARHPDDRFPDADEMIRALERAANLAEGRRSIVDSAPTFRNAATLKPQALYAATVPGGPEHTAPPSELTSSSISSAGTASVTVHLPPKRRTLAPVLMGVGLLALVVTAFVLGGGDDEAQASAASQAMGPVGAAVDDAPAPARDETATASTGMEADVQDPERIEGDAEAPDETAPSAAATATHAGAPSPAKPRLVTTASAKAPRSQKAPSADGDGTPSTKASAPPTATASPSTTASTGATAPTAPASSSRTSGSASSPSAPDAGRPALPDLGF